MEFYRLPKTEKQLIFKQIHEDIPIPDASIEKTGGWYKHFHWFFRHRLHPIWFLKEELR